MLYQLPIVVLFFPDEQHPFQEREGRITMERYELSFHCRHGTTRHGKGLSSLIELF